MQDSRLYIFYCISQGRILMQCKILHIFDFLLDPTRSHATLLDGEQHPTSGLYMHLMHEIFLNINPPILTHFP